MSDAASFEQAHDEARLRATSVWPYYAAVLGWTWAIWIPLIWLTSAMGDVTEMDLPLWQGLGLLLILQLGAYGPSIVAILFSLRRFGGEGAGRLLSKLLIWRVNPIWYVVVLLSPAAILTATIGAFAVFGGQTGAIEFGRAPMIAVSFLTLLLFGPLAEELGWRGYALPRLLASGSAARASLIMGAVATTWHVPLFFSTFPPMEAVELFHISFLFYAAYTIGRCFLYTWIFENTKGSVLMTVLFHAAGNTAAPLILLPAIAPELKSQITLMSGAGMWMVAAVIVATCGWESFRVRPRNRTT